MKIQIKELCEAKDIKSAYALAKKAELTMPTAYRAFDNDIKQFTPETLEKLCDALECTPNDIFGYRVAVAPETNSGRVAGRKPKVGKLGATEQKMLDSLKVK